MHSWTQPSWMVGGESGQRERQWSRSPPGQSPPDPPVVVVTGSPPKKVDPRVPTLRLEIFTVALG